MRTRTYILASALAAATVFGPAAAPVLADDPVGDTTVIAPEAELPTSAGVANDGTPQGPIVTQAVVRSFRAAPQNGANNLTVVYSCEGTATGAVLRTQITSCRGVSDTGARFQSPGAVFNGPAASSSGTTVISGNRLVAVCVAMNVRYTNGDLFQGRERCSSPV